MEQLSLVEAARIVLAYISPLIAGGALAKIGEEAADASLELLGNVWDALGRRFQGDRKAEAALTLYEDDPANATLQQKLADQLIARFQADPSAADELLALARAIAAASPAARHVALSGSAQAEVINQGDVAGDMNLFSGNLTGAYIAEVIHLYQQAPAAPKADYGAALRRYLSHLYATHASLDLRGIDDRPMDMPLSEIYVSLSLHEPPPEALTGRGGLRGFLEKVRGKLAGTAEAPDAPHGGRSEPVDWTTALRHPRLAVVGTPGSGKTTLLHFTAVRLAEVLARDDAAVLAALGLGGDSGDGGAMPPPVPLLLPLRELGSFVSERECSGREAMGANPRLLLDCLAAYYARFALDLPADFFTRLVDAGRALLLLDGLDEVVSREDREFVSAVVRSVATRYPSCRYVVTARVAAYQGDAQIGAGFRICTVADLEEAQQRCFIANWSRSLHRVLFGLRGEELERAAQRHAEDLWHALEMNERVRGLATNPLLLTVVAVIFYNNYVLPEDRAALYEECVEVLLRGGRGKADRAGQQRASYGGRPALKMGLDPRRELLAAVAYAMHQRGEAGLFISRSELIQTAARYLRERVPEPDEAARAFVAELPVHIGLLDEREPDRFRFSHLQFQEFLAARHIAERTEGGWDELLDRYQESWWREVILLAAGHLSQDRCWSFLDRLIARGAAPSERAQALALAADALAELERFKGQGPLGARIQAAAVAILAQQPARAVPAAARVACGRALAIAGDPRPGVCDLPPMMAPFPAGRLVIGSSKAEAEAAGRAYEAYYLKRDDKERAKQARSWPRDEINDQVVSIAAFELARYPVTNAQYRQFIEAGGYDPTAPWWSEDARAWLRRDDAATEGLADWQRRKHKDQPEFWDDPRFGIVRPNHPVVGVNWYEATAFCAWLTQHVKDGYRYRLPSEAEWEYAARGRERRTYPWGAGEPDGEHANFWEVSDGTTAVGCFPAGATPEGLLDMAGNVLEWTRSEYRPYPYDPNDGREDEQDSARKRFTPRGGSWGNVPIHLRAAYRFNYTPDDRYSNLGLRLARHRKV